MSVPPHALGGSMLQGEVLSHRNILSAPLSSGITMSMGSVREIQHIQLAFTCQQSVKPKAPLPLFIPPRR
jgi:hypothetical protein